MAFKLKMTLRGVEPKVTRTVTVPEDYTFSDLRHVVDKLMGWNGESTYAFYIPRTGSFATPADNPLDAEQENAGDIGTLLSSLDRMPFRYIYRPDERWQVDIEFQKDSSEPEFTIIKWSGDSPQEGFGGPAHFKKNPKGFPRTPFDPDTVSSGLSSPTEIESETVEESLDEEVSVAAEEPPVESVALPSNVISKRLFLELIGVMSEDLKQDVYYDPSTRTLSRVDEGSEPEDSDFIPVVMAEECLAIYIAESFIRAASPDMGIDVEALQRIKAFDPESEGIEVFDSLMKAEGVFDKWQSTRMLMGERTARQWLHDNEFRIEGEDTDPLDVSRNFDFVSVLMSQVDQIHLNSNPIPCRYCGNPCVGVLDKTLLPTVVSKIPHYAARISCSACGKDSVISLINDGYRRNYAFQSDRMVYPCYKRIIELEHSSSKETDPLKRAEMLVELAVEYNKVVEPMHASNITLDALKCIEGCDMLGKDFELYYKVVSVAGMSNLGNIRSFQMHIDRLKRRIDKMQGIYGAAFAVVCAFMSTSLKAIRNYAEKAIFMMNDIEDSWFKFDLMEGLAVCILRESKGDKIALDLLEMALRKLLILAPQTELLGPSTSLKQLARIFEIYMGQLELVKDTKRAEKALELMSDTFPFETSGEGTLLMNWLFRSAVHEILNKDDCGDAPRYFSMMDQACLRTMELGTYATSRRCYAAALLCLCQEPDTRLLTDSFETMISMFELKSISYLEVLTFINLFSSCLKERFTVDQAFEFMSSVHKGSEFFKDMFERANFDKSLLLAYEDIFLT